MIVMGAQSWEIRNNHLERESALSGEADSCTIAYGSLHYQRIWLLLASQLIVKRSDTDSKCLQR